jgi:hypothetical protein
VRPESRFFSVRQSTVVRARAKNPRDAKKRPELEDIRAMHARVANIAAAEVKDAFGS